MQKYTTTWKHKKTSDAKARLSLKNRRRFKKNKKKKNRLINRVGKKIAQKVIRYKKFSNYKFVKAPRHFSLLGNTEQTSKFINELKELFLAKTPVFVVMKDVMAADHSTIVVLLSIMIRFKAENISFNGDFPKDNSLSIKFKESGFFQILGIGSLKSRENYKFGNEDKIITHASKNVDSELSEQLAEDTGNSLHGEKRIFKGLHRTLIELMQNSFNHAEPLVEGDKHWWISVNFDKEREKVCFAFIDYGVGIFESLETKAPTSKWFNWKKMLNLDKDHKTNEEILRLILNGDLHKTVTGEYFRGKGLPGIKEAMDRNLISNLCLVTNNVFADVEASKYREMSVSFRGTFIYWEINKNTKSIKWIQ